jgi:HlyD family secretion protein
MMNAKWPKRATWAVVIGLVAAGVAWFAWPRPIPVDLATVTNGPMQVTVDDEAKTRVRHTYTVSAPIGGKVVRIPRHVGDEVVSDETIVAVMQATDPGLLDIRSREELQASLAAADAAIGLAQHEVRRIEVVLDFSRSEQARAKALADRNVIAAKALDLANIDVETNEHALASAKAQLEVRRSEQASIAALLTDPANDAALPDPTAGIQLRAPATGRILKILQESEAVVPAGTPLIEIGDPSDLEVVADLLSTDAVKVDIGSPVRIDGWGGEAIRGRVARIDPSGFVKVSALGIEEQRVRTIIELIDSPDTWSRLGDDYRVIVHVTVWSADAITTAPVSALFRVGDEWAVFRVESGRVRTTPVTVGHRNDRQAEIVAGLTAGDLVVLHPSDRIVDGSAVAERRVN